MNRIPLELLATAGVLTLAGCVPPGLFPEAGGREVDQDNSFLRAFYDDLAPAQAEAVRRTLRILAEERR